MTLGAALTEWASFEFIAGEDQSDTEGRGTGRGYLGPWDTLLYFSQSSAKRTSLRGAGTLKFPVGATAHAVITAGADGWSTLNSSASSSGTSMQGRLTGSTSLTRNTSHNTGGCVQGQCGLWDQVFFTGGLRVEWNPNYCDDATRNIAPRYGMSVVRDVCAASV